MSILDILFPKFCVGCNRYGAYLCARCKASIRQKDLICPNCQKQSIGGVTHPLCRKRYGLDGLWSLGAYQPPLLTIIQKLKYQLVTDATKTLTNLLIEYWTRFSPLFLEQIKIDQGSGWIIVPVPLHKKRLNFRGFNQSVLIASMLSRNLGLDYRSCLKRVRNTKSQVGLEQRARKENMQNAFALSSRYNVKNLNCLLFDDIWTSGATLKECCSVLKKAGVKSVWAITLAR